MKTKYILLFGIAIGLLLIISICDCHRVKPYSASRSFSLYEGLDDEEEGFEEQEEGFEEKEDQEGFNSMASFVDSPSNPSCSSGLSNSGGGLCLSKDEQLLLRTRGGNSSTGEAQIGN